MAISLAFLWLLLGVTAMVAESDGSFRIRSLFPNRSFRIVVSESAITRSFGIIVSQS